MNKSKKAKKRAKSLIDRKLDTPAKKRKFDQGYLLFSIEMQILNAMEARGMTFTDLAKALKTNKSNISRDLSAGGIRNATLPRLMKIAAILDMEYLPLMIPLDKAKKIKPKIHKLVAA